MKTQNNASLKNGRVEQLDNNITSWLGNHASGNKNIVVGQTFIAAETGDVASIEVFLNIITKNGSVTITVHSIDTNENSWGSALVSSTTDINLQSLGKWINFEIPDLRLEKEATYGFKIESKDSLIGIGEAVGNHDKRPFANGQEWQFSNNNVEAYNYFSLTFKVDLKAA